jgi:hypothetical protein
MMREDGFVSLLTAVMLSLLLLAITISLIGLQTLSLHKAVASEQSRKAYYLAESGVEDAIAKIRGGTVTQAGGGQPACVQLTISGSNVGWSCQTIKFSGSPNGTIGQPDTAVTVDPGAIGNSINSMTVYWDQTISPSAAYLCSAACLPAPAAGWDSAGPRAMPVELTIVSYDPTALISNNIKTINILVAPSLAATASFTFVNVQSVHSARNASCSVAGVNEAGGSGTYHCQFTITGLPVAATAGKLFRLESRYVGDNGAGRGKYAIDFFDTGGALVQVDNNTATIDVTGQSGTEFRRVIYKLPSTSDANGMLNSALFTNVNICKNYTVINGAPVLNPPLGTGSSPCPGGL